MRALTEAAIRRCMVNCSRSEAAALTPPRDLAELDWPELDVLGWRDPKAELRGYLPVGPVEFRLSGRYYNQNAAVFSNAVLHWVKDADGVIASVARAGRRARQRLRRHDQLRHLPRRGLQAGAGAPRAA